jgi:hypothetical protein
MIRFVAPTPFGSGIAAPPTAQAKVAHTSVSIRNGQNPSPLTPHRQRKKETIMKTVMSALLALSALAGVASQAIADENDGKSTNLEQMDRETRGGQGQ